MLSSLLAGDEPRALPVVDDDVFPLWQRRVTVGPGLLAVSTVLSGICGAMAMVGVLNATGSLAPTGQGATMAMAVNTMLPEAVLHDAWQTPEAKPLTAEQAAASNAEAKDADATAAAATLSLSMGTDIRHYVGFWRKSAFWVAFTGRCILVLPFGMAAVNLRIAGFTGIARAFKFVAPGFMGLMAFLFTFIGSLLVVMAPLSGDLKLCAWMSVIGCKLLIIFLIIATYFGHLRPMRSGTEDQRKSHGQSCMKNVAIIGGLIMIIGHDLPGLVL